MFYTSPRRRQPALLALSAAGLLICGPLAAQTLYGNLTGNVTDATNRGGPWRHRHGQQPCDGLEQVRDHGQFWQLSDSRPAPGQLHGDDLWYRGFGKSETKNVPVAVNQTKRIDASLALGSVTQSVEVNTAPPALQTDRADVNYEDHQHAGRPAATPPAAQAATSRICSASSPAFHRRRR